MTKLAATTVIVHVDDVGMCHGANVAYLDLMRRGAVTCGSVMVPCPWFRELAAMAAENPGLDIGVHLTLTSEWPQYRWGPISTASVTSGLIDDQGCFWRNLALLAPRLVPEAAETEFRAQIDRALAAGIDVTHLDTHMGAALLPALVPIYVRLGLEYRLPVLFPRRLEEYFHVLKFADADPTVYRAALVRLEQDGMPLVDDFRMTPGVATEDSDRAYQALASTLPEGTVFLALHPNQSGDIETIVPPRAHFRTDEYRLLSTGRFAGWLAERGAATSGYRELRDRWRSKLTAA